MLSVCVCVCCYTESPNNYCCVCLTAIGEKHTYACITCDYCTCIYVKYNALEGRNLMQASTCSNDGSKQSNKKNQKKLDSWIPGFYCCLKWGIIKFKALAPTITAQPGILYLSAATVIFLLLLSALSHLGLPQPRITPHLSLSLSYILHCLVSPKGNTIYRYKWIWIFCNLLCNASH